MAIEIGQKAPEFTLYDSEKNKIVTSYQTGIIPILNYKIEF